MKIHSGRLRKNKWNLSLTLEDARRNDEIVALADSQVLKPVCHLPHLAEVIRPYIGRMVSDILALPELS